MPVRRYPDHACAQPDLTQGTDQFSISIPVECRLLPVRTGSVHRITARKCRRPLGHQADTEGSRTVEVTDEESAGITPEERV